MVKEKNYPAGKVPGAAQTDNLTLAFWFEGLEKYGNDIDRDPTLPQRIDEMKSRFATRIRNIEHDITKHRKKTIRGKEYWYFWADGKHNSKGPVKGQPDPREGLRKEAELTGAKMKAREEEMLSCVVKKMGDHAVINVGVFRKFVDLELPAEAVLIKDMLSYPVARSTSPGKPDNKGGRS